MFNKVMIGLLVIIFGFFFVTVASRIVGIIGSSNSPISGMTIATIMGTSLVFIGMGWTGTVYEPMALVVGSMVCIAAANAGATSQYLKTGYLVGATPMYQQLALFIGVIVSSLVIGFTVKFLDTPSPEMVASGVQHAIGETYNAPQATLMATLIKGLLSFNLELAIRARWLLCCNHHGAMRYQKSLVCGGTVSAFGNDIANLDWRRHSWRSGLVEQSWEGG